MTCTPSREPLVQSAWLESDATIIAVGSDGPDKQELTAEVIAGADKVVADRFSQMRSLGRDPPCGGGGSFQRRGPSRRAR